MILTSLLVSTVFLNSCNKDELPSMSSKINSTTKNFIFRATTKGDIEGIGGFAIVGTTGTDLDDGEYLALLIRGIDVRTYDLTVTLSNNAKFECEAIYRPEVAEGETSKVYVAKSGTITITKIDEDKKKVSGTFTLTLQNKLIAEDVVTITDGKFENLLYTNASINLSDFGF